MDFAEPIVDGIRQNITGPGTAANSTTAEELFNVNWSEPAAPPIAGKTGTAQGRFSFPWNDSSVFAAFSQDTSDGRGPSWPTSRRPGSGRSAAAPVVKCMFLALSGVTALDPVADLRAARPGPARWSPNRCRRCTDLSCMESSNANTIYPGPVVTGRPAD